MGHIEVVTDHLQGAAKIPAVHLDGDRRDLRLDACRGLALWFIFIDHIPGNVFAWLTLRNYGFSDTTEVFVFVSGYTCMLAYGGALREQGWLTTVTRALRRGWEIYVAFLLLLIVYLAALVLAMLYLAFSLAVALSWQFKALEGFLPDALSKLIYPIDKSNLAPLRLLHFL